MARKRKDIHNLDEIENTRQREVAKAVATLMLERGLDNNGLADLCGISVSTVANIFRRQAKSLPSANVLRSIAVGLSTDSDGAVDTRKAQGLYREFMHAADLDINSSPFTIHSPRRKKILWDDLENIMLARIKQLPYKCEISHRVSPFAPDGSKRETRYFDMTAKFQGCPCLVQWNFLFSIGSGHPSVCTARFFYLISFWGYKERIKYSIVTTNKDVYGEMEAFDFSDKDCYLSVITVSEDGSWTEKYIETARKHEELDENGLTF